MAGKRRYILVTLVRAGHTHWEGEGRLHGATNLPLSDAGRAGVSSDLPQLDREAIATVYHAADEGATETAHLVAASINARTKVTGDLKGPDLGLFEGMLSQDLAERHPKRYKRWHEEMLSLMPPEGEAMADARARVFRAVAKLLKKSRAHGVAIVLHPFMYALLSCWLADRPSRDAWAVLEEGERVARFVVAVPLLDELRTTAGAEAVSV
ncbi:MAG: histidine phosphatase family protein [Phycisphaerales bacterium]|nr:histidine phosphatase family protein [Phycisphaerae bacterium]NNF43070.1 histidine phosphatase family protein [Phycisphaerales bacterium]NNM24536.1 histidine phosphatase family protein [Phycisphaerales bacterium]